MVNCVILVKSFVLGGQLRSRFTWFHDRVSLLRGVLGLQKSHGRHLSLVTLFWKLEFLIFAPKAPVFAFNLYFPPGRNLNVIGSFPLLVCYFAKFPKDILVLCISLSCMLVRSCFLQLVEYIFFLAESSLLSLVKRAGAQCNSLTHPVVKLLTFVLFAGSRRYHDLFKRSSSDETGVRMGPAKSEIIAGTAPESYPEVARYENYAHLTT